MYGAFFTLMDFRKDLKNKFGEDFIQKCDLFCEILLQWNKTHSMTTLKNLDEIYENIEDSVDFLKNFSNFNTFADIGTGAGFPGLIIAIAKPEARSFLLEPRLKRASFLNFAKNKLGLSNCTIINDRAENFVFENGVDFVCSRAVGEAKILLKISKNFSNSHTKYLFFKGSSVENEFQDLKGFNYKVIKKNDNRNYLILENGEMNDS